MRVLVPQPWVRVDVRRPSERLAAGWTDTPIDVTYSDSAGAWFSASDAGVVADEVLLRQQLMRWPRAASSPLLSHVATLPIARIGPYANGPAPLAVFLTTPVDEPFSAEPPEAGRSVPGRARSGWARLVLDLLTGVGASADKLELIGLGSATRTTRAPFRLPLRIHVSGKGSERIAGWLRDEPLFGVRHQEHLEVGLQVTSAASSRSADLDGCDVVVILDRWPSQLDDTLKRAARVRSDRRPRVVVLLRADADAPWHGDGPNPIVKLPAGIAGVRLHAPDEYGCLALLTELLQGVMHDLPLHECVASARRAYAATSTSTMLWSIDLTCTPAALDSIRMTDAYLDMQQRAYDLLVEGGVGRPPAPGHRARQFGAGPTRLRRRFQRSRAAADRTVEQAATASVSFQRETQGLWPIVANLALIERAAADLQKPADALAQLRADPDVSDALGRDQERAVSVWLTHLGDDGPQAVQPGLSMHTDQTYLLNAAIGVRWPTDLVYESVTPIDPLLPDPEGEEPHRIQFALFGVDFLLLSDPVVEVELPRFGASDLASFVIRSPVAPAPRAELRLIVYHDNNVLQVFHLTARVGPGPIDEAAVAEAPVQVRMDFSQGQHFRDVEAVGRRALSITSNDGIDGTHRIFLKGGAQPATLPISEGVGNKVIGRFRELLANTAADDTANNATLWELALLGSDIYGQLINEIDTDALVERLGTLRDVRDEVVQVIRIGANFPYPWPIVYDWDLPDESSELCVGPCAHTSTSGVFCSNGFWGSRLLVEEFIKEKNILAAPIITARANRPTCLVTIGHEAKDSYSNRLLARLVGSLGPLTSIEADSALHLLDIMWDTTKRPGVLLVIGHTTRERAGAFDQASIHTDTRDRLINARAVQKLLRNASPRRWEDPKALVLLMACDSGASDLEQLTDTMATFVTAGASAVIGAEVRVNTSEVHDFVTHLFDAFERGRSLGEAMQAFRRERIAGRRPDAFSFSAFGSADARLLFEQFSERGGADE